MVEFISLSKVVFWVNRYDVVFRIYDCYEWVVEEVKL